MLNEVTGKHGYMTSHDACVKEWAVVYKNAGWIVHADIPGYLAPPEVYGKIPDVYANCNTAHVIEVETDESINTDHAKGQIAAFKQWASQSTNRTFKLGLANAAGCNEVK
jgi:hypothetical protein